MPETIFISYASKNSDKVDSIVTRLRALKNPDGTWRYRIWQDKNRDGDGIPPGADWWEFIVEAYLQLEIRLADWMTNPRPDTNTPYPKDPSQDDSNDYVFLYDEACDFAWRLEFEKAERKFRLLTRRTGHGFDHEAYQWLEIFVKYKDLIRCYELKSARHKVPQMWYEYM